MIPAIRSARKFSRLGGNHLINGNILANTPEPHQKSMKRNSKKKNACTELKSVHALAHYTTFNGSGQATSALLLLPADKAVSDCGFSEVLSAVVTTTTGTGIEFLRCVPFR